MSAERGAVHERLDSESVYLPWTRATLYKARCACGWHSWWRHSEVRAAQDYHEHALAIARAHGLDR